MTTLAIYKLWSFLQSLSLTASNERWLAERLLESANAKSVTTVKKQENAWANYQLSPEILKMMLKNRKQVSDAIDDSLYESLEEKYKYPDRLKNLLNTLQSLNEDELIHQQHVPTRPERAEAPSPGQRPGYYDIQTNAL